MSSETLTPNERIIVALDVADLDEARGLVTKLGGSVGVYKIGLELIYRGGLAFAEELANEGHRVFLDAKLLDIEATVETRGKTGVEMEALTAVSVAALTVYDMVKAIDRGMTIEGVRLLEKHGGASGDWVREQE